MIIDNSNIDDFLIKGKLFYCVNMGITEIKFIPEGVIHIYCSLNKLKKLPILPNSLEKLECQHNDIRELPYLPEKLKSLSCMFNDMKDYPINDDDKNWILKHNRKIKLKKIISK